MAVKTLILLALSVSAQRTRLDVHTDNDNDTHSGKLNVYGAPLKKCSGPGMALTGFTREGTCTDRVDDAGSHHICITMWPNGAGHPGDVNFCEQTGQGTPPNDWCEEKMACHEDPTKECEIKNWCVCQWAWEMYVKKQGCENIVDLHCESVNMKALEACARTTSDRRQRARP